MLKEEIDTRSAHNGCTHRYLGTITLGATIQCMNPALLLTNWDFVDRGGQCYLHMQLGLVEILPTRYVTLSIFRGFPN
jgi:hypothetical protein